MSPDGDELQHEERFGRTDRYANKDDAEERARVEGENVFNSEEDVAADERRRRVHQIDDARTDDARMEVRREEHSADQRSDQPPKRFFSTNVTFAGRSARRRMYHGNQYSP